MPRHNSESSCGLQEWFHTFGNEQERQVHPWCCLSQFTPVSSGLDCYSHTWNLEIQDGNVAWLGWSGVEWSGLGFSAGGSTRSGMSLEVTPQQSSCSVILAA